MTKMEEDSVYAWNAEYKKEKEPSLSENKFSVDLPSNKLKSKINNLSENNERKEMGVKNETRRKRKDKR